MEASYEVFDYAEAMAREGNPASVSDAAVGALAARAAVVGALLNVRINAAGLKNRENAEKLLARADEIGKKSEARVATVLEIANSKIK